MSESRPKPWASPPKLEASGLSKPNQDGSPHRRVKGSLVAIALVIVVLCLSGYITRHTWLHVAAESLVCTSSDLTSDAILIDNVEEDYSLFERAQQLQARGLASKVFIPILGSERNGKPNAVSLEFVKVMCRLAHIPNYTIFHAPVSEPISLNLARRSAEELQAHHIRSILLITDGFRSRRTYMGYSQVLHPLGITVNCQPVFGTDTPTNWFSSLHGIQDVVLQFVKLWYYRLVVL